MSSAKPIDQLLAALRVDPCTRPEHLNHMTAIVHLEPEGFGSDGPRLLVRVEEVDE